MLLKFEILSKISIINSGDYAVKNKTQHNRNWPYILDHPYKVLIAADSGSGKTNALLHLINHLNHFDDPEAFTEYSNDTQYVHKNIDEYNIGNERKILIVFDDMIADMINNKKLNSIVTDLFIRGIKLNISLVFVTESYF